MLESGQALSARFVLVRRLGAGGGGSVWLAHDHELKRFVALKILADELMQDVAAIAALKRECERIGALDHPHILKVDALHRSPQHAWIAMEYVSGGDLAQLRGRSLVEILRAAVPVAGALAYAHRAGIVHRDVKPTNVLLMSDGTPRLADFGVALAVAETPLRAALGSRFNMSPQQLDGERATPADDIYGFGALLYELLSGYPPFYPDASPERVRTASPVALSAQLPPALSELVLRCLAKSPADRPDDMDAVQKTLQSVLGELPVPAIVNAAAAAPVRIEPPLVRPPDHVPGQTEALRGEWKRSGAGASSDEELRRQGFRRGITASALALGVVGIFVVFFLLPKWVEEPQPAATYRQAASEVEPAVESEAEKKELDFAALARAKQAAEELRAAIQERLDKLQPRAIEEWGGGDYRQVTEALASGDKSFAARQYEEAMRQFGVATPLLTALEKRVNEVLSEQLAAGAKALAEGRSPDARAAFEFANRVDAGNKVAARGLKRAGTLDEVLVLVAEAERLERQGEVATSADTFRQALALDAETARASEGLARVGARISADAFASTMAKGFSALSQSRYPDARTAFEAAGRMRPKAPEVAQALKQVEQEERTRVIAAKQIEARDLESRERWAEALQIYRAVLQLDSTVAFASEGVARTAARADLNQQLEMYLTQPERLFSIQVRTAARETLQRAAAVTAPGPVLKEQVAKLADWVSRSDIKVQVALRSDNLTQVTVYRVAVLGSFEQQSLTLAPGNYVVVGTRPGYRDVRREINVVPGATLEPVVIRCEDKI